jgi:hypothetical protein
VIKCNRCGMMNAADAMRCQSCGTPLSATAESGAAPRGAAQEPSELPAWLESLRAGERLGGSPNPTANAAQNFPSADFAEEGALPSWMRAERNEAQGVTGTNTPVPAQPSTQPSSEAGNGAPPSNIAARSLVDEQALPSWMQEGRPGITPLPPQEGIAASSLVQADDAPDWMKSLQQSRPATTPGNPGRPAPGQAQPQAAPMPPLSPSPSGTGFSARDLVDQQALPSWMQQGGPSSSSPSASSPMPPPVSAGSGPMNMSDPAGFSARDLVDQQSLPSWMQQGGQAVTPASFPSPAGPAQPAAGPMNMSDPAGFSARDLVDQQALPSWMQQGGQAGNAPNPAGSFEPVRSNDPAAQQGQGMAASSLLDMNSLPSWLRENGQQGQSGQGQASAAQAQPAPNNTVAASSFIDMNALPEWMGGPRGQTGKQPQVNAPTTSARPGPVGPPRVENVRVPSRPRGDISASETSEVAANVFASMLGVASGAPNYPAQHQGGGQPYQQGPQGYPPLPPLGGQPGMPGGPNMGGPGQGLQQSLPGLPGMSYPGTGNLPGGPGMPTNTPSGMFNVGGLPPQGYASPSGNMPNPMAQGYGPQSGNMPNPMAQGYASPSGNMPNPMAQGYASPSGNMPNPMAQGYASPSGNMPNPMAQGYGPQGQAGIPNSAGQGSPSMAGMSNPYQGQGNGSAVNYPAMGASQYPPASPGMGQAPAPEQKQGKKRGIVGALLDWLAR